MHRRNGPRVWWEDEAVGRAGWRVHWLDLSVAVATAVAVDRLVQVVLIAEVAASLVVERATQAPAVAATERLEASWLADHRLVEMCREDLPDWVCTARRQAMAREAVGSACPMPMAPQRVQVSHHRHLPRRPKALL